MIPDGTIVCQASTGRDFAAHCPRWWRLDRWLFWVWLIVSRRPRATLNFSVLEVNHHVNRDGRKIAVANVVTRPIRAYEIRGSG